MADWESGFMPNDVTNRNFALLFGKLSSDTEKRLCEIAWMAKEAAGAASELCRMGFSPADLPIWLSPVAGLFSAGEPSGALPENKVRLEAELSLMRSAEQAAFSDLFLQYAKEAGVSLAESDFFSEETPQSTVAYVRNALSDEAFDVFAQEIPDPLARYVNSFRDAAKQVLDGTCGYCLLPLEEQGGMRLPSVETLLSQNDLRIVSVTPVFGYEGDADLTYALVSSHLCATEYGEDDDRYLEIRYPANAVSLGEITVAARSLGVSLHRIHTVTYREEGDTREMTTAVFRVVGRSFAPLFLYLSLFVPEYTPVGLYKNLEV